MLFGWLILRERTDGQFKKMLKNSKPVKKIVIITGLWLLTFACLWVPIYTIDRCFTLTDGPEPWQDRSTGCVQTVTAAAFWNASFRIIWSIGVGMMIFLCDNTLGKEFRMTHAKFKS